MGGRTPDRWCPCLEIGRGARKPDVAAAEKPDAAAGEKAGFQALVTGDFGVQAAAGRARMAESRPIRPCSGLPRVLSCMNFRTDRPDTDDPQAKAARPKGGGEAASVRMSKVRAGKVRAGRVHATGGRAGRVRATGVRAGKIRATRVRAAATLVARTRAARACPGGGPEGRKPAAHETAHNASGGGADDVW
ncbi:hypothetical protein SAMN03080610_00095 [Afifella marina DSM 2698]|uniref:Uncharacterized protein n=1 Tax=Afifella marina DSM 2698 TaxID=1120955 RepID=A0A1G5M6K0_AFIMA|nr:hypothetical protein SAMN03080610_00095 [Afifella marina DSM 2698]